MHAEPHTCYRCQGNCAVGMLVERNGSEDIRWVSGDRRSGVAGALLGEGSGGDRERYRVATFRCSRCGALESFALDPA